MLHWNKRLVLLAVLVLVVAALAALGAGIHWDATLKA